MTAIHFFVSVWLKFLFLLAPFVVLSVFLSLTEGMALESQRRVAIRTTSAVVAACLLLFLIGEQIFRLLGITLDSFRIGAGTLLFLSAIELVQGRSRAPKASHEGADPSVVPLAIPVIVGPAVAGTVMVMAAECDRWWQKIVGFGALTWAVLCLGALLYGAAVIQQKIGRDVLSILVKLSGLILAALAAQIVFTGVHHMLAA